MTHSFPTRRASDLAPGRRRTRRFRNADRLTWNGSARPARAALYRGCLRTVRSARLRAPLRLNLDWFLNALLLEAIIVKRILALLLLIGALIGIFELGRAHV